MTRVKLRWVRPLALAGFAALGASSAVTCLAQKPNLPSKPANTSPAPHFRSDPMKPWWDTTPRQPSVLTLVDPVRIAVHGTASQNHRGVAVAQVRTGWRLSGVLTGRGVSALIEGPAGPEVVQPGKTLDDGSRVESIGPDSVTLSRNESNRTYIETIHISDQAAHR